MDSDNQSHSSRVSLDDTSPAAPKNKKVPKAEGCPSIKELLSCDLSSLICPIESCGKKFTLVWRLPEFYTHDADAQSSATHQASHGHSEVPMYISGMLKVFCSAI